MNVFFEATVQDMLQKTGVAVVVLRRHDHQCVSLAHLGGEVGVLNGLARIVGGQGKLCDIDEVGFNPGALAQFSGNKLSRVQAHAAHPGCTQDHRDE